MRLVQVTSLEHLRHLAADSDSPLDIVLHLNGGAKSSKHIFYSRSRNGRHWYLWEYEAGRYYTEPQLSRQTNIIKGIEQGALYAETEEGERENLVV